MTPVSFQVLLAGVGLMLGGNVYGGVRRDTQAGVLPVIGGFIAVMLGLVLAVVGK